jgi:hypothetical protein
MNKVKKSLILILIPIFLLATAIGVRMTALYCQGEISKIGLDVEACCKNVKKGGCCEKKSQHVKVKDHFIKTESLSSIAKVFYVFQITYFNSIPIKLSEVTYFKNYWDKAPPFQKEPHYILFRSLII